MNTRKFLAVIISAIMVFACFGITSFAAVGDEIVIEAEKPTTNTGVISQNFGYAYDGIIVNAYGGAPTLTYDFEVKEAGDFELSAKVASNKAQYMSVYIDDIRIKLFDETKLTEETDAASAIEVTCGNVSLTKGTHTLKILQQSSDSMYIDYFKLKMTGVYIPKLYVKDAVLTNTSGGSSGTWLVGGDSLEWTVNDLDSGLYNFTINKASEQGIAYYLFIDGENMGSSDWLVETSNSDYQTKPLVSNVNIPVSGTHTIKIQSRTNTGNVSYIAYERIGDASAYTKTLSASSGTYTSDHGTTMQGSNLSFQPGDSITWNTNVTYDGAYDILVKKAAVSGVQYKLYIDDELTETSAWVQPEGTTWGNAQQATTKIFEGINIKKGNHNIKLEIPNISGNGACVFNSLIITRTGDLTIKGLMELLTEGNVSIAVDIPSDIWGGETVYGALYYDGKLRKVYTAGVSGESDTEILNLNQIILADGEDLAKYEFKLFIWDNMEPKANSEDITYEIVNTQVVYVSPLGDDGNTGALGAPVKTIAKAQTIANTLSASSKLNVKINLAEGEYKVTSPITLTADNNHKKGGTITYKGAQNGKTVIQGGEKITGTWTKVSGKNYYVTDYATSKTVRQLWVNGKKAQRARSGLIKGTGSYDNTADSSYSEDGIKFSKDTVSYDDIKNESYLELVWDATWTRQRFYVPKSGIMSIDDETGAFLPKRYGYAVNKLNTYIAPSYNKSFRIENALCFLDEEGEFYYDRTAKKLYYYPVSNENIDDSEIYVGVSEGLIDIKGTVNNPVKNISFEDITLEHGTWLTPMRNGAYFLQSDMLLTSDAVDSCYGGDRMHAQVEVNYADNINFKNVKISHVGSAGISFTEGVSSSNIESCTITDTAAGGIMLGHWDHRFKDESPLTCVNNTVINNTLTNIAHEYGGQCGISAYYVKDTKINNNTLSDLPYTGISIGWGWEMPAVAQSGGNEIKANRISNYMNELSDGAGIYTLGNFTDMTVSENYIFDNEVRHSKVLAHGLYADQGTKNVTFSNNVIEDSAQWIYARDNAGIKNVKIKNNYTNNISVKYVNTTDTSVAEFSGNTDCSGGFPTAAKNIIIASGAK